MRDEFWEYLGSIVGSTAVIFALCLYESRSPIETAFGTMGAVPVIVVAQAIARVISRRLRKR